MFIVLSTVPRYQAGSRRTYFRRKKDFQERDPGHSRNDQLNSVLA